MDEEEVEMEREPGGMELMSFEEDCRGVRALENGYDGQSGQDPSICRSQIPKLSCPVSKPPH